MGVIKHICIYLSPSCMMLLSFSTARAWNATAMSVARATAASGSASHVARVPATRVAASAPWPIHTATSVLWKRMNAAGSWNAMSPYWSPVWPPQTQRQELWLTASWPKVSLHLCITEIEREREEERFVALLPCCPML